MSSAGDGSADQRDVTDAILDVVLYAPLGLLLDAQTVTPDLAKRGRQNAMAARQIGEFAVKRSLSRIDEIISQLNGADPDAAARAPTPKPTSTTRRGPAKSTAGKPAPEKTARTKAAPKTPTKKAGAKKAAQPRPSAAVAPGAEHLAIPDYDLLAASHVVKRLDGLSAAQLEAVRVYEGATRDRRTILHKIARLQG